MGEIEKKKKKEKVIGQIENGRKCEDHHLTGVDFAVGPRLGARSCRGNGWGRGRRARAAQVSFLQSVLKLLWTVLFLGCIANGFTKLLSFHSDILDSTVQW